MLKSGLYYMHNRIETLYIWNSIVKDRDGGQRIVYGDILLFIDHIDDYHVVLSKGRVMYMLDVSWMNDRLRPIE